MIWTHLICRKYIIFGRMNTQQLLAQHIPLLGLHRRYLIRTFRMVSRSHSLGVLLYHSCSAVCAVFLVTAGTLYPVEQCCAQVLSLQGLQVTETNIWRLNAFFPQEARGRSLPWQSHSILQLLSMPFDHYGNETAVFGHLVVQRCTKTILSDGKSLNLTAYYLPTQQPLSKSFPKVFHAYRGGYTNGRKRWIVYY